MAISCGTLLGAEPAERVGDVLFLDQWKVPVKELPLIAGSKDAENWIIVYSKWNCQICGMMHQAWHEVLKDFPGGKIGVVMLPGVSLQGVDALQKSMLAVWRADPQAYQHVAEMIWAGALTQNNLTEVRRNLADFMGGEDKLIAAEKNHAQWVDQQVATSAAMLRHLEKVTGDVGSYPKMTTTKTSRMGHLGSNANYRNFLIDQGWATIEWAERANAADVNAHANPARAIMDSRRARAPRKLDQIIDLGKIRITDGTSGKNISIPTIQSQDVQGITSNHGSLRASLSQPQGALELHIQWQAGLTTGAWESSFMISEKSGKKHIVIIKGETLPQ